MIGTHGRSFYVMDNIGVLRQASRETTDEPVVLFDPSDAIRSVSRGVAIDYYLKTAADKVTIEILDATGQSIVTFTGPPAPQAADGGRRRRPTIPERKKAAAAAAVRRRESRSAQGMNRFTWDMRYPSARDFPGMILWAGSTRGPQSRRRDDTRCGWPRAASAKHAGLRRSCATRACRASPTPICSEQFKLAKQINQTGHRRRTTR